MDFLVQQIHAAVAAGYAGMRIFGETSWAARGNIGSERLIEYEAKLNYLVDSEPAMIICPYQRRLFPASVLLGALHTHPSVISGPWAGENFYYVTPDEFLKPGGSGKQLARLLGTIPQQREEPGKWEANRTQEDLRHSPAEFRAATARLRSIREDERTRLARGLRNELGQALTAIKLEFARWTRELPNGQKSTTADSILSILTGALESVRQMKTSLDPAFSTIWVC